MKELGTNKQPKNVNGGRRVAEFPALPLFTDAYLADTTHLVKAVDHGRYLLMLIHMWRLPGCRMPNDDQWLARKFNVTSEEFVTDWRPIIAEFMQTDGNWIFQKRLQKEWVWCQNKRYQSSDAAKSRWGNENRSSGRISERIPKNAATLTMRDNEKSVSDNPLESNKKDACDGNAPYPTKKERYSYSLTTSEQTIVPQPKSSEWPRASPQLAEIIRRQMGWSAARATAPRDGALARPPPTDTVPIHELTADEVIEQRRKKAAAKKMNGGNDLQ